jgi:hypothetical protein
MLGSDQQTLSFVIRHYCREVRLIDSRGEGCAEACLAGICGLGEGLRCVANFVLLSKWVKKISASD